MKKIIIFSALLAIVSCSSDNDVLLEGKDVKDSYISMNLPKIETLGQEDLNTFKSTMKFNESGSLMYWDDTILEKAYVQGTEEYNEIIRKIIRELGYETSNIILISSEGDEYIVKNEVKNSDEKLGVQTNALKSSGDLIVRSGEANDYNGNCFNDNNSKCYVYVEPIQ